MSEQGDIGREQDMDAATREWIQGLYPNSFRPYLSMTMLQDPEPQGLLRGLVKPNQILRVRYKTYGEEPVWYTRKEFLNLGLETTPGGGMGPKKKVELVSTSRTQVTLWTKSLLMLARLSEVPQRG